MTVSHRPPRINRSPYGRWHAVRGDELQDAFTGGSFPTEMVVDCEAVYIWKRALRPPPTAHHTGDRFVEWLQEIATFPIAEVKERRLAHFAMLGALHIQGAPLSLDKLNELGTLAAVPKGRRWLEQFLSEVALHAAPLYVGESNRLRARIAEHMRGDTAFGTRMNAIDSAIWSQLDLHFYAFGPPRAEKDDARASKKRRAIEMLLTALLLAGYVERRG